MTPNVTKTYNVPTISCEHCVKAITESVSSVDGVDQVDIDIESKTVTVTGGEEAGTIAAISGAGYEVTS